MSTYKLSNISIRLFREYLKMVDCKYLRTNGGHEMWTRKDLTRPVTFQTHIDPIPERIIKSNLKTLSTTKKDFIKVLFNC